MGLKRNIVTLACLFAAASSAIAVEIEGFTSRIWTTQDGLANDQITALAQSYDGFLWVGSRSGLARFDGVQFRLFNQQNSPPFTNGDILCLFAASDGSLWIGTNGGGAFRLRGGAFAKFDRESGLTNGFVRAIMADKKGNLWAGTDGGLFLYKDSGFTRVDAGGGSPEQVAAMARAASGGLWVGGSGFFLTDGEKLGKIEIRGRISGPRIVSILQTTSGDLWLGTVAGLFRYKHVGSRGASMRSSVPQRFDLAPYSLIENTDGDVWAGMPRRGVARFAQDRNKAEEPLPPLPDAQVHSLLEDTDHDVWVATRSGLVRFSRKRAGLVTRAEGLDEDHVRITYRDGTGTLWIATWGGKLFQRQRARWAEYTVPGNHQIINIRNVFRSRAGVLFIGTEGQGFFRVVGTRVQHYDTRNGLANDFIRAFFEDRSGRIWVGTDNGLSRLDGPRLRTFSAADGLVYGAIRTFHQTRNGDIWIGTDSGVSIWSGGRFVNRPILQKIGRKAVWVIYEDRPDELWLGTLGDGLLHISGHDLEQVTIEVGFPAQSVYDIVPSSRGRVWVSTDAGFYRLWLSRLTGQDIRSQTPWDAIVSGIADGTDAGQTNGGEQSAAALTDNGLIWFPTGRGAVYFPADLRQPAARLAPYIDQVVVDGKQMAAASSIHLKPGIHTLEIHYSALMLRSPEHLRFRYRLVGLDDQWVEAGIRRTAFYTNLPPRRYTFKLAATAVGEPATLSLPITIAPYFYQTFWFMFVCLVATALLVAFGFWWRIHQIKARHRLVMAERNRLAREIHDTLIQGCTGVSTLLEAVSLQESSRRASEILDRARLEVRQTLQDAREAVWEWRHALGVRRDLATQLTTLAREMSREDLHIQVEADESPTVDANTERNVLLVVAEAMRNAIKHAQARTISVRISCGSRFFVLEVRDDGRGFECIFPPAPASRHCGLACMHERLTELGGRLSIETRPGAGTVVTAEFPLPGRWRFRTRRLAG